VDRDEYREVKLALDSLGHASEITRDRSKGRRVASGKQHVVDLAFSFFVRHSSIEPTGSPTGKFADFAREFFLVATGIQPDDDGGLDRQIRHAMTRLPDIRLRQELRQNPP